jgi:membrane fusion protein, heavy metal efflux system
MFSHTFKTRLRSIAGYLAVAAGAVIATGLAIGYWSSHERAASDAGHSDAVNLGPRAKGPAPPAPTIEVPRRVAELNHMAIAEAKLPTQERQLVLRGELAIDVNKLVHVNSLFPGRIIEVATIEVPSDRPGTRERRPLGFMDRVTKGQPLAVLWSKDLGEKKSQLVDALANLRLDEQAYKRMKESSERGATSENALREAEREVKKGQIAVTTAERTLRSWQVSEDDIALVKAEAEKIGQNEEVNRKEDIEWARVEIVAAMDGTIVEKNVAKGDTVDVAADLFKIADLSVLSVLIHAYEEDLPYLEPLSMPIPVSLRLPSNPEVGELPAAIEGIGDIINVQEHMAVLFGHVENPRGELKVGQFVTATVNLGIEEGVVEVPTRALVEDGTESVVFVQEKPDEYCFKPRRVLVAHSYKDVIHVRNKLSADELAQGLQELHAGERVAASQTVQLKATLQQQQLTSAKPPEPARSQH